MLHKVMATFKKREHYSIVVEGQVVEVTEEVYRIWLKSQNQERRHQRYFHNTYTKIGEGKWVTNPAWLIPIEDYSGAYKISGPERLEPEHALDSQWLIEEILAAVKELPDKCQSVIYLLYFKDYTQEAAAQILHISQPLLHYYKRKALALLREYFESKGYTQEDFS